VWKEHGLKPHLTRTFKLSNDPKFAEKVVDIVGLYLDPPDKARCANQILGTSLAATLPASFAAGLALSRSGPFLCLSWASGASTRA
jgi:hypothetical protein